MYDTVKRFILTRRWLLMTIGFFKTKLQCCWKNKKILKIVKIDQKHEITENKQGPLLQLGNLKEKITMTSKTKTGLQKNFWRRRLPTDIKTEKLNQIFAQWIRWTKHCRRQNRTIRTQEGNSGTILILKTSKKRCGMQDTRKLSLEFFPQT